MMQSRSRSSLTVSVTTPIHKEAWAEAVAQLLIDVPDGLHDQFLKDFPATNAVVEGILRKAGFVPFDYAARKARKNEAITSKDNIVCAPTSASLFAPTSCTGS